MQKILYALQHKESEDSLTKMLADHDFTPVGKVGYREGIEPALQSSPADVVLFRESLKGNKESMDTFRLMTRLRRNFPRTRIVFLANKQAPTSKLLSQLVFLGIYDIINSDAPDLSEIADFIINPRDFGYADRFFYAPHMDELLPEDEGPAEPAKSKSGGIVGLFGRGGKVEKPEEKPPRVWNAPISVDIETLRTTIMEEARREAQAELTQMVAKRVTEHTAELSKSLSEQTEKIKELEGCIHAQEATEAKLRRQLSDAVTEKQTVERQLKSQQESAEKALSCYEERLNALSTTKPPEWYEEQTRKWEEERSGYLGQIDEHLSTISRVSAQLQEVSAEKHQLEQQLAGQSSAVVASKASAPVPDADYQRVREENKQLRAQVKILSSTQAELDTCKAANRQLEGEVERLNARVLEIKTSNDANSALKERISSLEAENARLSDQLTKKGQEALAAAELKKAQQEVERLNACVLDVETNNDTNSTLKERISSLEAENGRLSAQLTEKGQEAFVAASELEKARQEVDDLAKRLAAAESAAAAGQGGIDSVTGAQRIRALRNESEEDLSIEVEEDDSRLLADAAKYRASKETRLIAFVGAKPGVGNTTVALNTAVLLAKEGYKTLFVEINRDGPSINNSLAFPNNVDGLSFAVDALRMGSAPLAARYLVKPHQLAAGKSDASKRFRKLPESLHFMNYNPAVLSLDKRQRPVFTDDEFKDLTRYLSTQEKYSYIIFDVQGNDLDTVNTLLNGAYRVHRVVMTMTQDTNCIAAAYDLARDLAQGKGRGLVSSMKCVVNRFVPGCKLTEDSISDTMGLSKIHFCSVSLDGKGHCNAGVAGLPYVLCRGSSSKEYEPIKTAIAG